MAKNQNQPFLGVIETPPVNVDAAHQRQNRILPRWGEPTLWIAL